MYGDGGKNVVSLKDRKQTGGKGERRKRAICEGIRNWGRANGLEKVTRRRRGKTEIGMERLLVLTASQRWAHSKGGSCR